MGTFEQLLLGLTQDQALFQGSEEATRQAAVLPLLAQLGWNTYNIREVSPEYSVGSGRVDYCLHVGSKKAMYIEVKRCTEELGRHERQLLEYAFSDGVELAALTNGLLWWLYLPLSGGNWQQRRFFTIDIREQAPETAARNFQDFLSREAVSDGAALTQARAVHASKEKNRLIKDFLPEAWNELFAEPDEALLALVSAKVESMCGYRPEPEMLVQFVRMQYAQLHGEPQSPENRPVVYSAPSRSTTLRPSTQTSAHTVDEKQHGATVRVNGKVFTAKSVYDLYGQVLEYLCDAGYMEKLKRYIPHKTSSKRYLLARQPVHPEGNKFRWPVDYNGYYMETHKSYYTAIKQLAELLSEINIEVEDITPGKS